MYQVFTYICTSSHEFITIYAQIIIKQHTSKNTIKILIYTQLLPNTFSITHSKIKLKTQQILISLTNKCHYRLTIYLHIKFNPNINLQLQIQLNISTFTYHHTISFLIQNPSSNNQPNILCISNQT